MFKTVEVKGLNKEEVLTVSERNRICLNAVVTEETRKEFKYCKVSVFIHYPL